MRRTKSAPNSTASTDAARAPFQAFRTLTSHAHLGNDAGTESTFQQYIKDPQAMVPGTKEAFAGLKDEQEAEDLWA